VTRTVDTFVLLVAAWLVLSVPLAVIVGRVLHKVDTANRSTPTPVHEAFGEDRSAERPAGEGGTGASAATG